MHIQERYLQKFDFLINFHFFYQKNSTIPKKMRPIKKILALRVKMCFLKIFCSITFSSKVSR